MPNQSLESIIKESLEGFPQNSKYIMEIPVFNPENGFPFLEGNLKEQQGACAEYFAQIFTPQNSAGALNSLNCTQKLLPDIIGLRFNIKSKNEIKKAINTLKEVLPYITLPLMIRGCGDDEIDRELLPELVKNLDREAIISSANENTYKSIIPYTKDKHYVVLKSPIDINLTKELNILSSDLGQPLEKIIIDTDIGGLGYGFEYGYSIIEKIKQEALKDKYLSMPIISFAGEEALKTKEAKSEDFSKSWGNLAERKIFLEITATSAVRAAGANLIAVNHPQTLKTLKGLK